MAAYGAVISLKNTIERLLNSYHINPLVPSSRKILTSAYSEFCSLEVVLDVLDKHSKSRSWKVHALDGQLREAVSKFEDLLESHVSNQILASQSESRPLPFSIDLQDLRQDIDSFTERVKKMEEEYENELCKEEEEEEKDDDKAVSSRLDFAGNKSKMVGSSDELSRVRKSLMDLDLAGLFVHSILGMPGIGKTALAREIFEDPLIMRHFESRAWATQGGKYPSNKIARGILAQVDPDTNKMLKERDNELGEYLKESLKGKRYLIVLDDLCSTWVWYDLTSSFPDDHNGSRILLTTRLQKITEGIEGNFNLARHEKCLLNKDDSWDLLREKVFAEGLCPPQLEKAGKKIAENCGGLPPLIIMVADLLSKADKTTEYWNKVAEKQNSVLMDAYNEISTVLYPSYKDLSQHLKPLFLYMGVFPQNYEIPRSKLFTMWIAEGLFVETSEHNARKCLDMLHSNYTLVIINESPVLGYIRTCRLHSSFRYICNKVAGENKFFYILSHADGLKEGVKCQRRLCIHNNVLFGIKGMYNSMEDASASTVRSLLCFGSYHQYPVPICFRLRLLRVLDALTIRFYEFPMEILKLFQLRYLALTYNGKLPASITKLWNLQYLIMHQHLSIKSCGATSYMPIEIWDMQELKHIQITGSNLPFPNFGDSLENLLRLLDVSACSCTKEVLERIPNLKKLGIQIESAPDDCKPLSCFDHIFRLHKLESLKCVVVNPELRFDVVAPPVAPVIFPASLQKLHLSGLGYPWEYMNIIGSSLLNLRVLKLRCYAFKGPKWEIQENMFPRIYSLQIKDTDLVQLKVRRGNFHGVCHLSIKHGYKLEELHLEDDYYLSFKIQLVDCNPSVKWETTCRFLDVDVHSSWDDGNVKS